MTEPYPFPCEWVVLAGTSFGFAASAAMARRHLYSGNWQAAQPTITFDSAMAWQLIPLARILHRGCWQVYAQDKTSLMCICVGSAPGLYLCACVCRNQNVRSGTFQALPIHLAHARVSLLLPCTLTFYRCLSLPAEYQHSLEGFVTEEGLKVTRCPRTSMLRVSSTSTDDHDVFEASALVGSDGDLVYPLPLGTTPSEFVSGINNINLKVRCS